MTTTLIDLPWETLRANASATKRKPRQQNPPIMGATMPVNRANDLSQRVLPITHRTGLKGVYNHSDFNTGRLTGLYRASILPVDGGKWYTLGTFKHRDTAAYVFNLYALTMGLENLVNHNIKPDSDELKAWRRIKPENVTRERQARARYTQLWGH